MGLTISTQKQIEDYFNDPGVNQSSLRSLLKNGPKGHKKSVEEPKPPNDGMLLGSFVDHMLLSESRDMSEKYYVLSKDHKLSELERDMVKYLYERGTGLSMDSLGHAAMVYSWYNGKPGDTRFRTLLDKSRGYYEELEESSGKQLISVEMYGKGMATVNSLESSPVTARFFDRPKLMEDPISTEYQKILFSGEGNNRKKAMLDISRSQENNISAYDLKTTYGEVSSFPDTACLMRYDIQAAWYTDRLRETYPGREVTFGFIVESTTDPGNPMVFYCTDKFIERGRKGLSAINYPRPDEGHILKKEVKGYQQVYEDYLWYTENGWDTHRDYHNVDFMVL